MAALTSLTSLNCSPTAKFEDLGANPTMRLVLTTVSASLSMLGTLTMTSFIAWEGVPSTSRLILVYVSVADFLIAGSNLYGLWIEKHSESECKAQSFVTTCASLCSFFWTTFLAVFMYVTVAQKKASTAQKMLKGFFSFGWGIPIAVTAIALGENALGTHGVLYSAGWCWISSTAANKNMWMWLTGKAWEIAAYILISIFYGLLKYHIRREVRHHQTQFITQKEMKDALKAERRLTFVPVIFILLRIWGTLRFILFTYTSTPTNNKALDVMLYLQGIGDCGQGFANFVLFCLLTEKFQFHLRRIVYKCVPCLRKHPNVLPLRTANTAPIQHGDFKETTPLMESLYERTVAISPISPDPPKTLGLLFGPPAPSK